MGCKCGLLERSRERDQALLGRAAQGDAAGYFQIIAREQDERNICGFPPTLLLFEALGPSAGRLLHYASHVDAQTDSSVSWATMVFDG